MKLENQVAIVTAAGRGIGKEIALSLAAAGAKIVVNSFSQDTTAATVQDIQSLGGEAVSLVGDITDPIKMIALRDLALAEFGKIDILVNNVGAGPKGAFDSADHELGLSAAIWDGLYEQNLKSVVLMSDAVIPHMKQRKTGKLIQISSIAGRASLSDKMLAQFVHPAYGAMKAALINYTQTQAELLGPYNINVNAVCPGIVYTDAWKGNAERAVKTIPEFQGQDPRTWFEGIARGDYPDIFDRTPLRREQTVEDIGNAVVFLVSSDSMNITGQTLMVDGGMVKI
ncbi:MAG: SDR family NAD(P)-dependent oxidoreductase [bacterium]|nr:SDR family oxidoreductase [Gammaproteobacteria bacterium]HIL95330.1 SDR family oxidoreductase [Pseudomonadales bacterium]